MENYFLKLFHDINRNANYIQTNLQNEDEINAILGKSVEYLLLKPKNNQKIYRKRFYKLNVQTDLKFNILNLSSDTKSDILTSGILRDAIENWELILPPKTLDLIIK